LKKLPQEVKQLLKKAGIKPKELKNKDTALDIFNKMIETVDFSQKKNDDEDNYARGDVDQTSDSGGRSRNGSIMNNLGEGLLSRIAKNAVDLMDTSV
jgi:hypothetical protein